MRRTTPPTPTYHLKNISVGGREEPEGTNECIVSGPDGKSFILLLIEPQRGRKTKPRQPRGTPERRKDTCLFPSSTSEKGCVPAQSCPIFVTLTDRSPLRLLCPHGFLQKNSGSALPCLPPGPFPNSRDQTCVSYLCLQHQQVALLLCHLGSSSRKGKPPETELTESLLSTQDLKTNPVGDFTFCGKKN